MLLQREKSTKNKLLKKWQICSNNNKKKSGSKKLTSVTGVDLPILTIKRIGVWNHFLVGVFGALAGHN